MNRVLFPALVVLVAVAIGVGTPYLLGDPLERRFEQIHVGMTIEEVDRLLGPQQTFDSIGGVLTTSRGPGSPTVDVDADYYKTWATRQHRWWTERRCLYVAVKDGKVIYKEMEEINADECF